MGIKADNGISEALVDGLFSGDTQREEAAREQIECALGGMVGTINNQNKSFYLTYTNNEGIETSQKVDRVFISKFNKYHKSTQETNPAGKITGACIVIGLAIGGIFCPYLFIASAIVMIVYVALCLDMPAACGALYLNSPADETLKNSFHKFIQIESGKEGSPSSPKQQVEIDLERASIAFSPSAPEGEHIKLSKVPPEEREQYVKNRGLPNGKPLILAPEHKKYLIEILNTQKPKSLQDMTSSEKWREGAGAQLQEKQPTINLDQEEYDKLINKLRSDNGTNEVLSIEDYCLLGHIVPSWYSIPLPGDSIF